MTAWVMVRRPLLLALFLGCTVSLQASGRLSARLIADGALSSAFIPAFEIAAFGLVYSRGPRPIPFFRAADLFFVGNTPWLLWLIAFDVLRCFQAPVQATAPPPTLFWGLPASLLPVAAWSMVIDRRFFRQVLQRSGPGAIRDLILQRLIAWPCAIVYFLGYAIWPLLVAMVRS